jgi:hypothetical protein
MKFLPVLFLSLIPISAEAITWKEFWQPFEYGNSYYERRYIPMCNRRVYHEEYVPGNYWRSGYMRRWTEIIRVPCEY